MFVDEMHNAHRKHASPCGAPPGSLGNMPNAVWRVVAVFAVVICEAASVRTAEPTESQTGEQEQTQKEEPKSNGVSPRRWETTSYWETAPDLNTPRSREWFAFEFGLGGNWLPYDDAEDEQYLERLLDFGFAEPDLRGFRFNLAVLIGLSRYFSVGLDFGQLETGETVRAGFSEPDWGTIDSPEQWFDWNTYGLFGVIRGHLWGEWEKNGGAVFAQAGVGLGIAASTFQALTRGPDPLLVDEGETRVDYALTGAVGGILMLAEVFGVFVQTGVSYTPVLRNEFDEHHDTLSVTMMGGAHFSSGAPQ